jgi:nucleoside-diphosphate-sugar epimerase
MPRSQVIKKSALIPTALISGGAGFIGSHIAQALLDKQARVIALDNFSTGKEVHIKHLLSNPNFALYDADINEGIPAEIESVDYVLHLASIEEYLYSREFLNLDSLLTNSLGVKNLLDFSRHAEAKFILASTIDVYQGRMSQLNLNKYFGFTNLEDNKYSLTEAKRFAEALVWQYYNRYGMDVRVARVPEIYGPYMNLESSGSIGSFLKDLIERRDIVVHGDGNDKEYYLYIDDAVNGILKCLFNPNTRGNIYSLVTKEPTSVLEAAYLVKSLADAKLGVLFEGDSINPKPPFRIPDTFNLGDLNWESKIGLKEGVVRTLQWFGYSVNNNSFKPAKVFESKGRSVDSIYTATPPVSTINQNVAVPSIIRSQNVPMPKPSPVYNATPPLVAVQPKKSQLPNLNGPNSTYVAPQVPYKPVPVYTESTSSLISASAPETSNNSYFNSVSQRSFVPETVSIPRASLFERIIEKLFKRSQGSLYSGSTTSTSGNGLSRSMPVLSFLAVLLAAFATFIGYPGYKVYSETQKGIATLNIVRNPRNQLNSDALKTKLTEANASFASARSYLVKVRWLFRVTGKTELYTSTYKLFSSIENFTASGEYLSNAVKPFENLWDVIRPNTDKMLNPGDFESAKYALNNAKNSINLAVVDYKYVNTTQFPQQYRDDIKKYGDTLNNVDYVLNLGSAVVADLPQVLGATSEKKYLIWFQNSNELRPTGGFIGSYGILKFKNGKLQELMIDDIYNPDGQIDVRGIETAAPLPIKELLGESNLHLRNANWNPDFTKSASEFDDLYYKVTGEEIDGYIAIDLTFAKKLLEVSGPMFLAAYDETLDASNLYERTQYHSDFNYQEGSDQKRSFLTVMGGKLLDKIFNTSKERIPDLLGAVESSLNERHLMIYFKNSSLNAFLKNKAWDGSLVDVSGDYLNIVNSNLGGTKSNYYVKNTADYALDSITRDGLLRANLNLTYQHTGESDAWPGGPYTNYLRVLTQNGTKLTSAKLIYSDGSTEDIFDRVLVTTEGKYTSFETTFKLNTGKTLKVALGYDLPASLSITKDTKNYTLYWQKQAGTTGDAFSFKFAPPFGLVVDQFSTSLTQNGNSLEAVGKLDTDLKYLIKLQ